MATATSLSEMASEKDNDMKGDDESGKNPLRFLHDLRLKISQSAAPAAIMAANPTCMHTAPPL